MGRAHGGTGIGATIDALEPRRLMAFMGVGFEPTFPQGGSLGFQANTMGGQGEGPVDIYHDVNGNGKLDPQADVFMQRGTWYPAPSYSYPYHDRCVANPDTSRLPLGNVKLLAVLGGGQEVRVMSVTVTPPVAPDPNEPAGNLPETATPIATDGSAVTRTLSYNDPADYHTITLGSLSRVTFELRLEGYAAQPAVYDADLRPVSLRFDAWKYVGHLAPGKYFVKVANENGYTGSKGEYQVSVKAEALGADEWDPADDSPFSATPLTFNHPVQINQYDPIPSVFHTFSPGDTTDWHAFDLARATPVRFTVTDTTHGASAYVEVFRRTDTDHPVAILDSSLQRDYQPFAQVGAFLEAGAYLVRVTHSGRSEYGSYSIAVDDLSQWESTPTITSFAPSVPTVAKGESFTLATALSFDWPNERLLFYRDANDNGTLERDVDVLVGTRTNSDPATSPVIGTAEFPAGTVRLFCLVESSHDDWPVALGTAEITVTGTGSQPTPAVPDAFEPPAPRINPPRTDFGYFSPQFPGTVVSYTFHDGDAEDGTRFTLASARTRLQVSVAGLEPGTYNLSVMRLGEGTSETPVAVGETIDAELPAAAYRVAVTNLLPGVGRAYRLTVRPTPLPSEGNGGEPKPPDPAPAGPALSVSRLTIGKLKRVAAPGTSVPVTFTLTNESSSAFAGTVPVEFALPTIADGTPGAAAAFTAVPVRVQLDGLTSRTYRVNVALPPALPASRYGLAARLKPAGAAGDAPRAGYAARAESSMFAPISLGLDLNFAGPSAGAVRVSKPFPVVLRITNTGPTDAPVRDVLRFVAATELWTPGPSSLLLRQSKLNLTLKPGRSKTVRFNVPLAPGAANPTYVYALLGNATSNPIQLSWTA